MREKQQVEVTYDLAKDILYIQTLLPGPAKFEAFALANNL